jgi:hypothetical protein
MKTVKLKEWDMTSYNIVEIINARIRSHCVSTSHCSTLRKSKPKLEYEKVNANILGAKSSKRLWSIITN